jgi:hypothetical protein
MALFITRSAPILPRPVTVKGQFFGARGDSCSCDPCDCNPCRCGDGLHPNLPFWRVSGCVIEAGNLGNVELADLVLLSLSQPRETGEWQEFFLVANQATDEQIAGLLAILEDQLESLPAEIEPLPRSRRAVYRVPLEYRPDATRPFLHVALTRENCICVYADETDKQSWPREWIYDGPMALRGKLAFTG